MAWRDSVAAAAAVADAQDADLVVINAKVYTVDARMPRAEAFAVKGGRFVAVGSTADIKALAGKSTQTFDAKGMTVVPGFCDCHNHAPGTTLLYDVIVGNPYEVEFVTITSIVEKLRAKAKDTPPGTWVEGYFFDDTKVQDKRELNVHDLDEVSKEHPVVVQHRGGHTSYYNSKALEMAGITKDDAQSRWRDVRQGRARRSERPRDRSRARACFSRVGKRQTFTAEQRAQRDRDGLAYISKQFVRYGLTSVHHEGGDLHALQDVRARGELLHRVSYEASGNVLESMITSGIATGFGDEWIKFGATSEHTVDGSFSERTMAMSGPYPGMDPEYRGNITETQDDLNAWVERVHRAGIQVNCHANGDVAIDMMLTAVERAQKLFPRADARPKITHCTLVNDDLIRRMKAIDAIPAPFTIVRLLQRGQVPLLRRGADEAVHGVPVVAGRRHSCRGRLGFQSRPVRAADGHAGHGDAQGLERRDLGREPAGQRRRGAADQHAQRRLRVARRSDQGIDHAGQARGLRRAGRRSAHGEPGEDQGHPDRPHRRRRSRRSTRRNVG